MTDQSNTPLLDKIKLPSDMRDLSNDELRQLADELRDDTVRSVSITGGHLGASLGVVELTVALHHVFDTPSDRILWDVGHQCYPHKILTGRREQMNTLRQGGGLSGFTKRAESEYDPFGAAHSSTSISAGLGMAVARDLSGGKNHVISVIGDGAMTAGMAYEAMNNAGSMDARLIVILNDNDMSIAPPVGALSAYLSKLISSKTYRSARHFAKNVSKKFPRQLETVAQRAEEYARGMVTGGTLFEELGFYYVGPIDGHNLDHLIPVLKNLREDKNEGPVLLHIVTEKGHGYKPAEESADKYHGVGDVYPSRSFDVGIAEQHGVTFAAGMATEGYKPFVAIYSTFLQRAYDQIVHDVAIQSLPVRFAIDRAGYVGADGQTHCGAFDIAYLATLPDFVIMAAADEAELMHMTRTAATINDGPSAIRYPRGEGVGVELPERGEILEIGKGRIIREGKTAAILSLGGRLQESMKAAEELAARGLSTTVADARFVKPLDHEMIRALARNHEVLVMIEEGAVGGFGSHVLSFMANDGLLENGLKVRSMTMPDAFLDQDKPEIQYEQAKLDARSIVETVMTALGREGELSEPARA